MRKAIAMMLIGALGFVLQAASCGGNAKDVAGKAVVAAEAAYHVVVEAELAARCGQPTSIPDHCITPEKHAQYKALLLQVYNPGPPPSGYLQNAKDLWAALPEGNPSTAQIFTLISEIGKIIQQIIAGLPQAPAALAAADPNVVKTIKAVK
jgi:hypothetical protein